MPNSPSLARRWLNTIGKIAAVVGLEDQGATDLDLAVRFSRFFTAIQ